MDKRIKDKWKWAKFTKEQLEEAIKNSFSIRQVKEKLGMNVDAGGSYSTLYKYIKKYNLDTSHFTGQLWSKGKQVKLKTPTEKYLSNEQKVNTFALKKRLFRDNLFERKCYNCNLSEWQGKPIPTDLHHIDGNKHNNNLSNLTILCPNCHAQTDNYCSKNTKSYKAKQVSLTEVASARH